MKNFENEKWEVIEHSWSDTSIYNQENELICTLSIDDEEREQIVSENFALISKAPEMYSFIKSIISSENTPTHYRQRAKDLIALIEE